MPKKQLLAFRGILKQDKLIVSILLSSKKCLLWVFRYLFAGQISISAVLNTEKVWSLTFLEKWLKIKD